MKNTSSPAIDTALLTLAKLIADSDKTESQLLAILAAASSMITGSQNPAPAAEPAEPTDPAARLQAINRIIRAANGAESAVLAAFYAKSPMSLNAIKAELLPIAVKSRAFGKV